jgi:large repetitive protein
MDLCLLCRELCALSAAYKNPPRLLQSVFYEAPMILSSALTVLSGRSLRRAASAHLLSLLFFALMANVPLIAQSLLVFSPSAPSTLSANLYSTDPSHTLIDPEGAAIDSSGNIFVVDADPYNCCGALLKYSPPNTTPTVIDSTLEQPYGVTVDSSGNIYVGDSGSGNIYKYAEGSYTKSTIASEFISPGGVAVDSSGNIYVADFEGGLYKVPYTSGSYSTQVAIGGSTFAGKSVYAVSLDSSGNVYATLVTATGEYGDDVASSLYKLTGSGTSYTPTLIDSSFYNATGIAIDPAGNVYVSDDESLDNITSTLGAVYKETLVSGTTYTKSSYINSIDFPESVVIDKNANFYIPNFLSSALTSSGDTATDLYKVSITTPPSLTFPSTTVGSDSTTQIVTVTNIGNAALDFTDVAYPEDFSANGSDGSQCTSSTSLAVNETCNLPIQFSPQEDGSPLNEDVTLTDNTLGVSDTQQPIAVSGTATGSAVATHLSISAPGTAIPNTSFSIIVTALTASNTTATSYAGAVHFTSSDGSAVLPANSALTSGVGAFSVTLKTGGNQTVTATDTVTGSISGTSGTIVVASPALAVVKSHTGTFTQGQTATWTIQVSNTGTGATTGATVTVSDTLATGYTLASYTGTNWSCSGSSTVSCTSTAVVAGSGGLFPLISLVVNVPANSATSVSNTAQAWGGGDLIHTSSGTAAVSNTNSATVTQVAASITANAGSTPQSTQISTSFANPLAVTVKDANNVVIPSASITFTAPASGSSGIFSNSSNTIVSSTNSSGVASNSFTANTITGNYTVTASVVGVGSPATFSLTNDQVSSITSANSTTFTVGTTGSFTITTTGYPVPALSDGGATLPTAVIFTDNGNGTATISGIPAAGTGGVYTFTITASNGVGTNATQSFTLTVDQAPAITSANSATFITGVPASFTVTTTGYPTASLSEIGTLPTGVTFVDNGNGTGSLSGTAAAASTGIYNFNITASNGVTPNATQSFTLTVNAPPNYVVTNTANVATGTPSNCPIPSTGTTCSLRDALAAAYSNGSGNITFSPTVFATPQTINIGTGGPFAIPEYTSITGATSGSSATLSNLVTVSGAGTNHVFFVGAGINGTSINNLIIENGNTTNDGGGIYNNGTLTVNYSTVSGNIASGYGGGIVNLGTLTVNNSTISGNSATGNGGGIENNGTLTVNNSTFSGNSTNVNGGGIENTAILTVNDSTFSGNSASSDGGGISNAGTLTIGNSIVSGNTAANGTDIYNSATQINLDGNQLSVSGISLASLGWYGGPTETIVALPGSPAICGGLLTNIPSGITTDQRGNPRTTTAYGSSCVDSGATQSAYSLSFTTSPSSTQQVGVTLTPSSAVQLYDNGVAINLSGASIAIATNAGTLSGTTPQTTSGSGVATFGNLSISPAETNDYLIASASSYSTNTITADSSEFNIDQLTQTITFNPSVTTYTYSLGGTFDVSATSTSGLTVSFGSLTTGVCTVSGTTVSILSAGTCTIQATQAGNTVYSAATPVSVNFTISQATATISITPYSVTYDGNAHTATGTATGAGSVNLNADLNLSGTTHTNAGTYSDTWTFHDPSGNYADASGSVTDSIGKATATINVTPYDVTYDGNAHTATGTAKGVGGVTLSGLSLSGTTHTNAGNYTTDPWTFTDTTGNYQNASGTVSDTIGKATATINVTPYNVTYDGNAHTATGTATGVGSVTLSGLNLSGTTHTNAGSYPTDPWTFTDTTGNYQNASGTVSDTIGKATATISVTPYSVTYDGNPHTATGTATGVGSVTLSGLNLSGTTHTNAGNYPADPWTFTDTTGNYQNASGMVADSIGQATAIISVTPYNVTYDGNAHTAAATATGVGSVNLNADMNLSGTTHTNAGTYSSDPWSFTDPNGNYKSASGTVTDIINKASQTITFDPAVTLYTYSVDGTFSVSATASSGLTVSFASLTTGICTVSGTTVTMLNPGTCTIQATQGGNSNYNGAAPVSVNFTIGQIPQTITFNPSVTTIPYSPTGFTVSATASSGLTVSFASTTTSVCTVSGTTVSTLTLGQCTIVASQAGNADYKAAPNVTVNFNIIKASQTINFSPATTTYPYSLDGTFTVSATATSGLPVSFASTTASVCTMITDTVVIHTAGTCSIVAMQAGGADYNAASPVTVNFTIAKASQTIIFITSHPIIVFSPGGEFNLDATASSGLPITYTSESPSVCTISTAGPQDTPVAKILTAGNCIVEATQPGNTDYAAAYPIINNFTIQPATSSITLSSSAASITQGQSVTLTAAVSSTTTGTLTGSVSFYEGATLLSTVPVSSSAASLTTSTLTNGTDSITAQYSGNTDFHAVTSAAVNVTVAP